MCGIVGYYDSKNVIDHSLEMQLAAISHRGPDMNRIFSGNSYRIAFNRLAINDISEKGMQPFRRGHIVSFTNGEIFNAWELANELPGDFCFTSGSDCEIVPFLYEKYGVAFAEKINGDFASVIVDEKRDEIHLFSDRFSLRPLFYSVVNGSLFFSSEIKGLRGLIPMEPDWINSQISTWYSGSPSPLTPFKNIFRLGPGERANFRNGQLSVLKWYNPQFSESSMSDGEMRDCFVDLLKSSVKYRLVGDRPIGISLSGGIDSSLIAVLAAEAGTVPIRAYTAKIADKQELEPTTDNDNPPLLASELGMSITTLDINFSVYDKHIIGDLASRDEIMSETSATIFPRIAERASRDGVVALLDGVGADELSGGYPWQCVEQMLKYRVPNYAAGMNWMPYMPALDTAFRRTSWRAWAGYRMLSYPELWHAERFSMLPQTIVGGAVLPFQERLASMYRKHMDWATECMPWDYCNMLQLANFHTLVGCQVADCDRGGMRSSVESRSPFSDHRLIEFMFSISTAKKWEGGQKSLVRRFSDQKLPRYITHASKTGPGFPLAYWFDKCGALELLQHFIWDRREFFCEVCDEYVSRAIYAKKESLWASSHALMGLLGLYVWYQHQFIRPQVGISLREYLQT